METGELGVLHLRRYWCKRLLEVGGRLDQDSVRDEYGLDFTLMQGLGLGIVEPAEYLFQQRPTYAEFEQWIVQKLGGVPERTLVERLNKMVRHYLELREQIFRNRYCRQRTWRFGRKTATWCYATRFQ